MHIHICTSRMNVLTTEQHGDTPLAHTHTPAHIRKGAMLEYAVDSHRQNGGASTIGLYRFDYYYVYLKYYLDSSDWHFSPYNYIDEPPVPAPEISPKTTHFHPHVVVILCYMFWKRIQSIRHKQQHKTCYLHAHTNIHCRVQPNNRTSLTHIHTYKHIKNTVDENRYNTTGNDPISCACISHENTIIA